MRREAVGSFLAELRTKDVRFELQDDRVRVDAPEAVLSEADRSMLRSMRDEVRSRLEFESTVLDMSLDEYRQTDLAVELAVPWFDKHLWLVPDPTYVDQLIKKGVGRGQIWTAREMADLYAIDGLGQTDRIAIAKLKVSFGIEILSVEPWTEAEPAAPEEANRSCRTCHGSRFWRSTHGAVVCGVCQPPMHRGLVAKWLGEPAEGEQKAMVSATKTDPEGLAFLLARHPSIGAAIIVQIVAEEQLRQLRIIGLDVWLRENRIEVYLPAARELTAPRPLLAGRSDLLAFERNLDRFVDRIVDHATTTLPDEDYSLYLVPADDDVPTLQSNGIGRGQIWTRAEASTLLDLPYPHPEVTRLITHLKLTCDAELVGGEVVVSKRDPHHGVCPSTLFWESVHGQTICARCHPPASPHLVARWSGVGRLSESHSHPVGDWHTELSSSRKARRKSKLTEWVVFETDDHGLDVHHIALAHWIDPARVVARVRARRPDDALRAVITKGQRSE